MAFRMEDEGNCGWLIESRAYYKDLELKGDNVRSNTCSIGLT